MNLSLSKMPILLLLITGCHYRFGEPGGDVWSKAIHIEVIGNDTLYTNLPQNLRLKLSKALKTEQGPQLGQNEKDALSLGGRLLEVEKVVFEKDTYGRPTELQFNLTFALDWMGKTRKVSNTTLNPSSGLYRPYDSRLRHNDAGRALSELEALEEALDDLTQAIILEIRRPEKS